MNTAGALAADSPDDIKKRLGEQVARLPGLAAVEDLVRSKLESEAPLLQEIGTYLLELGGKRMRPVLALLCARAFGMREPSRELIEVAAGIELIHMATLLHDDIIDKSPLRRHRESALHRYGMESSLLCGDFLLTRAFSLCAHLDEPIIEATEQACIDLTEGEILETPLTAERHDIESSLRIARKKTASLFRLAAFSAAHLSVGTPEVEAQACAFGEQLGIAFQILDDVLDVIASEATLGKRAGQDLRERKPAIVNVLWLASGSSRARTLLEAAKDESHEEQFVREALAELRSSPTIREARALAEQHAERARSALHEAASGRGSTAELELLIDYTLSRLE
jgi:octaprenyl-diphosphate synthase